MMRTRGALTAAFAVGVGLGGCAERLTDVDDDPSALIGLPLLTLTTMLESAGIEVV